MKKLNKLLTKLSEIARTNSKGFPVHSYGEGCFSSEANAYDSILFLLNDKKFLKEAYKMYGIK